MTMPDAALSITYYTDPLCCWSWGFEPVWQRLLTDFKKHINYRYCLAGLLPGWSGYHDPINAVSRPIQMGPVWMHAREVCGVDIRDRIWYDDPPASSYPACVAIKCAALQSAAAGEAYLRRAREAVMAHGINIARQSALFDIADSLALEQPTLFDATRFHADFTEGNGMDAFRSDLNETRSRDIRRFPTLLIRPLRLNPVIVSGYRPYDILSGIVSGLIS